MGKPQYNPDINLTPVEITCYRLRYGGVFNQQGVLLAPIDSRCRTDSSRERQPYLVAYPDAEQAVALNLANLIVATHIARLDNHTATCYAMYIALGGKQRKPHFNPA